MNKRLIAFISLLCLLLLMVDCTRRRRQPETSRTSTKTERRDSQSGSGTRNNRTVVRMSRENGVYSVPCRINGVEMKFVFDTGASDITMSQLEATFLYRQGKITDDDFVGTQEYILADGSVAEGTTLTLRTVEIGNRTLKNVQASIVHNMDAPLLLGQSALAQFGKISIDYQRNEIIFE